VSEFPPVPEIEEPLHISPYELFRRLADGEAMSLIDLRPSGRTLRGATHRPDLRAPSQEVQSLPHLAAGTILVDWTDTDATELARRLRAAGHDVRALYGGIELWEFALDPQVVGEERFLTR
jgi:hypothetical protein